MGINIRVKKSPKSLDVITAKMKLERDLKSCMRCRFFYGNNSQCIASQCVREERKAEVSEQDMESECFRCPYRQSEKYCFPCTRDILAILKKKPIVNKQEEKKDG